MWLPGYQWRHYRTWRQTCTISTYKWQQRVSVCFLFTSRTLVPRSTLVYRWSRLKEESPGILFEGKVEWASGSTSHLQYARQPTQCRQGQPLLGYLSVWQLTQVIRSKIRVKEHCQWDFILEAWNNSRSRLEYLFCMLCFLATRCSLISLCVNDFSYQKIQVWLLALSTHTNRCNTSLPYNIAFLATQYSILGRTI